MRKFAVSVIRRIERIRSSIMHRSGFWWRVLQVALILAYLAACAVIVLPPIFYLLFYLLKLIDDAELGFLGSVWIIAIVLWSEPSAWKSPWAAATRPALAGVIFGLTPQILFLVAYNALLPHWPTRESLLRAVVLTCELGLLRLHLWLKPIEEHGLLWLALVIAVGGMVAFLRHRPAILSLSLKTFARVKYVYYVVVVAVSFTVASSVATGNYQPDARLRLAAEEARGVQAAVGLLLTEEVAAALRSADETNMARFSLLARAVEEEERAVRFRYGTGVNWKRAERAGVRATIASELSVLADEPHIPARPSAEETADPIDAYDDRRRDADAVEEREEAAKETLKAVIGQLANFGKLGAEPFDGLLHEYLVEVIDEAADYVTGRILANARFADVAARGRDTVDAIRSVVRPTLPNILSRLTATSGTVADPRLPEDFRVAEEGDITKQRIEVEKVQRRETEEAVHSRVR